jgi:predicted DCC family thiol-disulfide oxidoreductase YuxK
LIAAGASKAIAAGAKAIELLVLSLPEALVVYSGSPALILPLEKHFYRFVALLGYEFATESGTIGTPD